jgi:hypothetical protein
MTARQQHGFDYENYVFQQKNYRKSSNYIDIWDGYDHQGTPLLLKFFKDGSELPLSDVFRNSNRRVPFRLIWATWSGNKNNIVSEGEIMVDGNKFSDEFVFEDSDQMKNWIQNVSNDHSYDPTWKSECKYWKEKWGKDRIVQPRFKRDHKTQKRIQSAVANKNITTFFEKIRLE